MITYVTAVSDVTLCDDVPAFFSVELVIHIRSRQETMVRVAKYSSTSFGTYFAGRECYSNSWWQLDVYGILQNVRTRYVWGDGTKW